MTPQIEKLVGRAMLDAEFRQAFLTNPMQAIENSGITLSDDELQLVAGNIGSLLVPGDISVDATTDSFWF